MAQAGIHATVYVDLQGKGMWVNTYRVDEYGKWGCLLYPNDESLALINKMKAGWYDGIEGIRNELKKDEDGYNIRLARPQKKERRNGPDIIFTPPLLLKADGATPMIDTLVGNGSDITCNIELYFFRTPNKKLGSAIRLRSIRVDNLIPYESKNDMTPEQKSMAKGLDLETAPRPAEFGGWK